MSRKWLSRLVIVFAGKLSFGLMLHYGTWLPCGSGNSAGDFPARGSGGCGHRGGVMNHKDSMPVAMDALLSFHVSA